MKRVGGGAFKRDFMPVGEGIQAGLGDKIWIVSRYIKGGYTGLGDKIWIVSRYIKGEYTGLGDKI